MNGGSGNPTVRLTVVQNEPMARLAEQRLRQEGIRCYVRPLGAGPGGWGTAVDLPFGLYVKQADEMAARQVLELAPLEIVERERARSSRPGRWSATLLLLLLLAAALLLGSSAVAVRGIFS